MLIYHDWLFLLFLIQRHSSFLAWNSKNSIYIAIFSIVQMLLQWITQCFFNKSSESGLCHSLLNLQQILINHVLVILHVAIYLLFVVLHVRVENFFVVLDILGSFVYDFLRFCDCPEDRVILSLILFILGWLLWISIDYFIRFRII